MPQYVSECKKCGNTQEFYRTIADMDRLPKCCGQKTHRIIVGGYSVPDIQPYRSMADGTMITSRSQHRDHLKRHGVVEIGNEIAAHLKPKPARRPDREVRRRQIAEVLNSKA